MKAGSHEIREGVLLGFYFKPAQEDVFLTPRWARAVPMGVGGVPEGVPKVRGESELNALRMFILL